MMNIAVIDDEHPARRELCHQIRSVDPSAVIDEADSGAAALELVCKKAFDLVFLDINLGDVNGTSIAAAIQKINKDAQIIFATAYPEYAVKAFELGVADYILKPFDPARVQEILIRCRSSAPTRSQAQAADRLAVSHNDRMVIVNTAQIVYIEAAARGVIIHTTSGDYTDRKTLGECELRLPQGKFFRIYKSYIVNLDYVVEILPWYNKTLAVKMQGFDNCLLPVGRDKKKVLYQMFNAI